MAAVGVFVFVFALLGSIALHELGHLMTAKRFGMKASRYFIGMGPTLWSTWRGETEYGVKAFPVGGFVKIVGMTQLEDVEPGDEPRAFWRQPAPQRAVVLAAGSAMHFLIAFVVLLAALLAFGEPKTETTRIDKVNACLQPAPKTGCTGLPLSPALVAGVQPGDRVVAFDGAPIVKWADLTSRVQQHPAGPAELVVLRDGQRVTLHPVIRRVDRYNKEKKADENVGMIGLAPGEMERYNPIAAVGRTGVLVKDLTTGSLSAMAAIPAKIPDLFKKPAKDVTTGEPAQRAVDDGGLLSVVDLGRFSAQAFEQRAFLAVLSMIAALNVFVGLFNLLPLLPLDGGHLAILGFEQGRSRLYKFIGRRDPGRVDLRRLMPAMVAFIVLMGSLTLMLVYAGITNPVANPFNG